MLTDSLRPTTWDDVAGQKLNIQLLKAIVKNPEKAPKSLILEGAFGSGKTTSARILVRELNNIKDPNFDLNNCPFYSEYDSTVIGNVEEIRKLRDVWGTSYGHYWNVVVLDECHSVSNPAQTALLKVLEEIKTKTFFILCTTHVHKVIPTIRSRSLELTFTQVPSEEVVEHLTKVEGLLGIQVPQDIKEIIAARCQGHMRNAHMLLDKYLMIGEELFKQSVKSGLNLFCTFLLASRRNNQNIILKTLNELCTIPLVDLKNDFSEMIMLLMRGLSGLPVANKDILEVVQLYGNDVMKITKTYFGDWVKNMFQDNYSFQAGMLCFYNALKSENEVTVQNKPNNLVARAMVNPR